MIIARVENGEVIAIAFKRSHDKDFFFKVECDKGKYIAMVIFTSI